MKDAENSQLKRSLGVTSIVLMVVATAAIKKDEQPDVFEAMLAEVSNFMTELIRTG